MVLADNNPGIKWILCVVALQVMNMSIDIPSSAPGAGAPKDYNYSDCYVEYITEVVLQYENAIPESKHRQQKQYTLHHQLQIICQVNQLLQPPVPGFGVLQKPLPAYSNRFTCQHINEVNPPPPRMT